MNFASQTNPQVVPADYRMRMDFVAAACLLVVIPAVLLILYNPTTGIKEAVERASLTFPNSDAAVDGQGFLRLALSFVPSIFKKARSLCLPAQAKGAFGKMNLVHDPPGGPGGKVEEPWRIRPAAV